MCYKKKGGLEATECPPLTRITQQNAGNLFGNPTLLAVKSRTTGLIKEIFTAGKVIRTVVQMRSETTNKAGFTI